MVVDGEVEFDGKVISRRDVIEITDTNEVSFNVKAGSQLMLIEVPMNF